MFRSVAVLLVTGAAFDYLRGDAGGQSCATMLPFLTEASDCSACISPRQLATLWGDGGCEQHRFSLRSRNSWFPGLLLVWVPF